MMYLMRHPILIAMLVVGFFSCAVPLTIAQDAASPAPATATSTPAAADAGDPTQSPAIELADTRPADLERGKKIFLEVATCADCHGWPGDGQTGKEPHSEGDAANLRETQLDTNSMIQIVSCGIPGSAMPYHDRAAYQLDKRCYGTLMSDYKSGDAPHAGKSLSKQDIINVVAYVQQKIKGRGTITKAECEEILKPGNFQCAYFK